MSEPLAPEGRQPGTVYTFYSYKGGVGRSMALANVGVILASQGLKVLLVDWDLEAPGLEVYFRQAARLMRDPAQTPGVVDLLEAHAEQRSLHWRECLLRAEFADTGLDLITAGSRSEHYRRRVQQLDWESLFREHRVGNFVNDLREEWRQEYDAILVDSRTGITDIGDICTVLLPDVLILFFVTNHQNIEGLTAVMERASHARAKLPIQRGKLLGVPVSARDERDRESGKFEEWHRIFAKHFDALFREWLPRDVTSSDALLRLFIPYIAAWSFGESLPVLEGLRERADPSSLGAAYARLASLLAAKLDWSAMDARADPGELASSRLEAARAREAARLADEAKRAAEMEIRTVTASKEKELQAVVASAERVVEQIKATSETVAASTRQAYEQELQATRGKSRFRIIAVSVSALLLIVLVIVWAQKTVSNADRIEALASPSKSIREDAIRELSLSSLSPSELDLALNRIESLLSEGKASWMFWLELSFVADKTGDRFTAPAIKALKDSEQFARGSAAVYLSRLSEPDRYAASIAPLLDDPERYARYYALRAMSRMSSSTKLLYKNELIKVADSDTDVDNRKSAANILKEIGVQGVTSTQTN